MNFISICERLNVSKGERPDDVWLKFADRSYTFAQFAEAVETAAAKFSALDVGPGTVVPTFFGNTGEGVEAWFACAHLGAVWAPVNLEFRGGQLVRCLTILGASTLCVDQAYLPLIAEVEDDLPFVQNVVVRNGGGDSPFSRIKVLNFEDIDVSSVPEGAVLESDDLAMIQFTSGSTGLPKGVELSHGYLSCQARVFVREYSIRSDDTLYCPFPLYHWDATVGTVLAALYADGTAALGSRFSVSNFWSDIERFGATVFDFMGATLSFLHQQPEAPGDADNPARMAWGVPMPAFRQDFERRFGLELREGYGSTEGGVTVYQRPGETYPEGSCGRIAPEYLLRIMSESGEVMPSGEVGEIQTRPKDDPSLMMSGYVGMPDKTTEMMRDGWYRTGDLGWVDGAGNLFFSGRLKDIIRRRGENISALEIETVLLTHPDIVGVAAYGVPSEHTEEDVAVSIVTKSGQPLCESDLAGFCESRMARYMIPAFIRFVEDLPQTGTGKISKPSLKAAHAEELRLERLS